MQFLLYERVTLRTALSPAQIGERLASKVEPSKWFRWSGANAAPFEGRIEASVFEVSALSPFETSRRAAFKIMPVPKGRNSYIPVIVGRLVPEGSATLIDLSFRLPVATLLFQGAFTVLLWSMLRSWGRTVEPAIALAILWGMCLVFFNEERRKAKRSLCELFEGNEVVVP